MRYVACAALAGWLCTASALVVHAQERPSAALLATSVAGGFGPGAPEAFDRVLRSELGALDRVRVHGSVALELDDVQLALGCEGETQACLGAVAREIGVRFLLLPNLDRIGSEAVLSVALFDADADGAPRRVARRASGPDAEGALVSEVRGLLEELFGVTAAPTEEPPDPVEEPSVTAGLELPPPSTGGPDEARLATAGVVLFVGVAGLALGVGFGVSTLDRQAAYERAPTDTVDEAEEAGRRLRQANEDAITANVLFVAGGVATGAGLVWLIAEVVAAPSGEAPEVSVTPLASPTLAGVSVSGRWP
ncbi:MAG: hypothetical protein H6719_09925 [Sandaracinaceae bacterium]|nr:hypothetical protein [Sandaracinaceae bacterium]